MHRSRLILALTAALALLSACKKSEEQVARTPVPLASGPADEIYAASAHLRILDAAAGKVVAPIDLSRAVSQMVVSADGKTVFVAASDGVRQLDAQSRRVLGQLTNHPARRVELDDSGQRLWVLEHDVVVQPDGTREVLPFRLLTLDLASGKVAAEEEVGQRVQYAAPAPEQGGVSVAITDSGDVRVGRKGTPLADGTAIDVRALLKNDAPYRVRGEVTLRHGDAIYVPVEGEPSQVLRIDRMSGEARAIALGGKRLLRGLAVQGQTLVVNAMREVLLVDLEKGTQRGELPLSAPHTGLALGKDGKFAYLAQTIDGTGGSVTVLSLDPLRVERRIHLDDISPWAIAAVPL